MRIAARLKAHGCDTITSRRDRPSPTDAGLRAAVSDAVRDRIRHEADTTMTVGNLSSYADANRILAAGRADLCVLARAHLYDPYWTHHAAREQGYDLPWPDQYLSVKSFTPRVR